MAPFAEGFVDFTRSAHASSVVVEPIHCSVPPVPSPCVHVQEELELDPPVPVSHVPVPVAPVYGRLHKKYRSLDTDVPVQR